MRNRYIWVVAVMAAVTRLPSFLASRHLGFDDGVYGASALAMRDGGVPFRDVFSSQGPLFLPLVWLADLIGFRTHTAPRILGITATVVLTIAAGSIATRLRSHRAGLLAAILVGTSGSVLWVTGPLTSDGIATALAALAVAGALAYDDAPSAKRAFGTALALAAALAIKSLLLPAAVPIAIVLLRHRRSWHLVLAFSAGLALALLTSLPFGVADVWDQSVAYHLEAAGERTPGANFRKITSTLGDRDAPLLVAGAVALGAGIVSAVRTRRTRRASGRSEVADVRFRLSGERLIWVWWAAVLGILVLEHPLWRNHLAHLVVPSSLLVACGLDRAVDRCRGVSQRAGVAVALGVAVVVGSYHVAHTSALLNPGANSGIAAEAVRALEELPQGAWAISDEPGIVWSAGRRTPANLVDTSILRIESGRLTAAGIAGEASVTRVCAVVVWSYRFGDMEQLGPLLRRSGYELARQFDDVRRMWIRSTCRPG